MPDAAGGAVAAAGGAAPAGAAPAAQPQRGGFLQSIFRMAMMWYVMRMFTGSGNKTGTAKSGEPVKVRPTHMACPPVFLV